MKIYLDKLSDETLFTLYDTVDTDIESKYSVETQDIIKEKIKKALKWRGVEIVDKNSNGGFYIRDIDVYRLITISQSGDYAFFGTKAQA